MSDTILPPGWPTRRLKRWPVARDFEPTKQKKRISTIGYQKVVGAVRAMFTDDALGDTLIGLQDFCFQQGDASNANGRDRAFFFDVLTHDLVCFEGDRGTPILDDLPLDPKVYDALPHMQSSYLDLYRVESRGLLGGARLRSLSRERDVKAGVRPMRGPRRGEVFVGRVVQIGRGYFVDDPILTIDEALVPEILATWREEFAATRDVLAGGPSRSGRTERRRAKRRAAEDSEPALTAESFLKVSGYHLYERAAAAKLARVSREQLDASEVRFDPRVVRYRVRRRREMLDLESLAGGLERCRIAERDGKRAVLAMCDLAPSSRLTPAIREAMVTVDGMDLLVMSFVESDSRATLEAEIVERLPENAHRKEESMAPNEVYRSLRHTVERRSG